MDLIVLIVVIFIIYKVITSVRGNAKTPKEQYAFDDNQVESIAKLFIAAKNCAEWNQAHPESYPSPYRGGYVKCAAGDLNDYSFVELSAILYGEDVDPAMFPDARIVKGERGRTDIHLEYKFPRGCGRNVYFRLRGKVLDYPNNHNVKVVDYKSVNSTCGSGKIEFDNLPHV